MAKLDTKLTVGPTPELAELVTGLTSLTAIKDGWKTTEFKLVAASLLVGVAALALPFWLGAAHPAAVVAALIWGVMANAGIINYTNKRTKMKTDEQLVTAANLAVQRLRNDNPLAIVAKGMPTAPEL